MTHIRFVDKQLHLFEVMFNLYDRLAASTNTVIDQAMPRADPGVAVAGVTAEWTSVNSELPYECKHRSQYQTMPGAL